MRGRERVRGDAPRANLGQQRRSSFSPAERYSWGVRESGRLPQMGRDMKDGDEWTEVRPRRRKEP
ncbi:hypothetical protein A2U01_0069865 [Trifolium medium]|uniref:Uncharacterized protein n=1 Tax=Trifolium medium TaxID=97028 RepID=A0A392SJK9_9FABA|nr:hypothetical protein [Trifolium medium]